jgi:uncharacterized protein (DUF302 family)
MPYIRGERQFVRSFDFPQYQQLTKSSDEHDHHQRRHTNPMEGLITMPSNFGPKETMDRMDAEIKSLGMTVFARINHAALAVEAGLTLQPTEVIIFGNPRAGTPLMQAKQTLGIDLPLKGLVWQDASGKTWLSYNKPNWLAKRHGIDAKTSQPVNAMSLALSAMARKVTGSP